MPTVCDSTTVWNSLLHRLLRLVRDDAQAIAERQARLDAAHDDVDGVGEIVQELVLPPLLQKAEEPARDAEAAGKGCAGCCQHAAADEEDQREQHEADPDADHDVLPLGPAQAGLRDAHRKRQVLLLLLPDFQLLERFLDCRGAPSG